MTKKQHIDANHNELRLCLYVFNSLYSELLLPTHFPNQVLSELGIEPVTLIVDMTVCHKMNL